MFWMWSILNTKIYRCLNVQVCLSTVGRPSQIQEQTSGKWKPKIFNERLPLAHTPRYSASFYLKHRFTAFGLVALKSCKHVFVMLLSDLCKLPAPSPLRKLPSAFVTRCRTLSKQQNMVLTQMLRIRFAILVYMYDGCIFLCRHIFCRAYGIVNCSPSNGCSQNPAPVLLWAATMVSQQVI